MSPWQGGMPSLLKLIGQENFVTFFHSNPWMLNISQSAINTENVSSFCKTDACEQHHETLDHETLLRTIIIFYGVRHYVAYGKSLACQKHVAQNLLFCVDVFLLWQFLLCICTHCQIENGSCTMFQEFEWNVANVNQVSFIIDLVQSISTKEDLDRGNTKHFFLPGSTSAVAASSTSDDTAWFVNITAQCLTQNVVVDDYGHTIPPGHSYLEGHYLEKVKSISKGYVYIEDNIKQKGLLVQGECCVPIYAVSTFQGQSVFDCCRLC